MRSNKQSVSVLIPCRNEENFIAACLDSLLTGSFPTDQLEILVIDGMSSDKSPEIIKSYREQGHPVRYFENSKGITPTALNIGIENAYGEIVMFVGAHAVYDKDYINLSVKTLTEEKCASVGGVIVPTGNTKTGKAIAIATSTRFGIGNAKYRYANTLCEVDTVFGGCILRENLLRINGFDESWVRNQDYELNFRLRETVGKIILNPLVKCHYFCREKISHLAKQYFSYGFWRFNTLRKHPKSFSHRQAAPIALTLGLISSLMLLLLNQSSGLVVPFIYGSAVLLFSVILAAQERSPFLLFSLPIIFPCLHLSWGLGFLASAIKSLINRFSPS